MNYNTTREYLTLPAYGRHIQGLVQHAVEIKDNKERQEVAEQIIALMGFLIPQVKTVENYEQTLWDHLFVISDFKLDVKSPYPIPTKEEIYLKPTPIEYPQGKNRFRHYGRNIKTMIDKAVKMEDPEKKQGFMEVIASFMKRTYNTYHKEGVNDNVIIEDLERISDGALKLPDDHVIVVRGGMSKPRNTKRHNSGKNNRNKNNNYKKRQRR